MRKKKTKVIITSKLFRACPLASHDINSSTGYVDPTRYSDGDSAKGQRPKARGHCWKRRYIMSCMTFISPSDFLLTASQPADRCFHLFCLDSNYFCGVHVGSGVRTVLWKRYSHNRKFYLKRSRYAGYQSEMARSVFCLCPLGWAPWSPRLVESVALGCVPVIIADGIRLPFPSSVPWPTISLTVPQKDIRRLSRILDRVASTNLSAIQRNLWDPSVRRALLYHGTVQGGDAMWHILDALSRRKLQKQRMGQLGEDAWR